VILNLEVAMRRFPRSSGVVMHPTSFPGPFGIGDLGEPAYRFVDFLVSAGQTYWQVLPLSPTGYGDSPYQGLSAFAGNPMLISPEMLVQAGHLFPSDLASTPDVPPDRVDFGPVIDHKTALLDRAFFNFRTGTSEGQWDAFRCFCDDQAAWLDDLALFMALKQGHQLQPWHEWEQGAAAREPEALERWRRELAGEIEKQRYLQWVFFEQWLALKEYANGQGVRIIGDIPIFVALDSADVWANPDLFHFDEELRPTVQSGVPPDYFSKTGQLWGHPIYRWDVMAQRGYDWWVSRFQMAFTQADVVRVDHFRGFYNYWEVPAEEKTAVEGRWLHGPGAELFRTVTQALGDVAIIAEDLGDFDQESRAGVDALQREFGYPGMKVMQFAFWTTPQDPFMPHNFDSTAWVVYTGTHDNDTVVGWWEETSTAEERAFARAYLETDGSDIAWDMIRMAWGTVGNTAMTTTQDLLSLGHESRMNTPSTLGPPNWCWRLLPGVLTPDIAARLRETTRIYNRLPEAEKKAAEQKPQA
jgi:4-alpha-glucanotransferase